MKELKKENDRLSAELKRLRFEIEKTDYEILDLIKKRTNLGIEIGRIKKEKNTDVADQKQHDVVIKRAVDFSQKNEMDEEHVKIIFEHLTQMSVNEQKRFIQNTRTE